ncbi:MAG: hypothetical protein AAGA03_15710 [Planctomycetota bacterium]
MGPLVGTNGSLLTAVMGAEVRLLLRDKGEFEFDYTDKVRQQARTHLGA